MYIYKHNVYLCYCACSIFSCSCASRCTSAGNVTGSRLMARLFSSHYVEFAAVALCLFKLLHFLIIQEETSVNQIVGV